MDGLELIKTFREVALRQSFSRAALSLGISKATVSKYVTALESRSGVRLLNRSTRSLSLTEAGEFLLARSVDIVDIADRTLQELEQYGAKPQGRLRLSAPYGMSGGWLSDILSNFILQHPDIFVSLDFRNDHVDLVEEGIDIWLGTGPAVHESLIVRQLATFRMVLCASPGYWASRGMPKSPADLARHALLSLAAPLHSPIVLCVDGAQQTFSMPRKMEANDGVSLIELAVRGTGPTYVPEPLAQHYLERGMLVAVLSQYIEDERSLFAAYSQRRHNSAAMRLMLSFLQESTVGLGQPGGRPLVR